MKKLFALMMVLAMLLSCTAALADAADAGEAAEVPAIVTPLTIYSETDIDRDALALGLTMLGKDEAFQMKADAFAAVLTEAAERLTLTDNGFQWDLLLSGKDIFTVAGEFSETGFTLGSNLFPGHVFSFTNEELARYAKANASQYAEQAKAMERIDVNALARAFAPHFANFFASSLAAFKAGESIQGDYTLNGNQYNTKVAIDVDVAALSSALTQLEKDLLADPTVAVTIAQFDKSGKHTEAVEKAIDPANAPAVHVEIYSNVDDEGDQSGPVDITFTATMPGKNEPAATGDVLSNGEDVTANIQYPAASTRLVLTSQKNENGHTYRADVNVNGLYFGCVAEVGEKDGKTNDTDLYFLDPQKKLAHLHSTMTHEGGLTFDLSKGAPVTLSQLTAKDRSVMTGLSADAMVGLASISTAAVEALPEEVNALLALFSLSDKG